MIRPSLASKLLLLSLVPATSVVVAGVGIERSFSSSRKAEEQVLTAIGALELANDVASLADEAILEERGFLVTGGEGFAEPYYAAVGIFSSRITELEQLFADAPERQDEARQLAAKFRRWQEEVAQPAIAARRRNEVGESASLVASTGRQLSHDINDLAGRITRGQGAVVRERLLESGRIRSNATRWIVGMVVTSLGFAMVAGAFFAMQLRRRLTDLEIAAEALARGDFDRRAPTSGGDEIDRLAHSFNAMADQVQGRTLEAVGLRKLSELLQACSNVKEAFEVTEMVLPSLMPESRGVIHIVNASRSLLEVTTHFGLTCGAEERSSMDPSAPSDCWAFRRGVVHRVEPGESMPSCRHVGAESGSYLCIPLLAHGESLGVMTLTPLPDELQSAWAERLAEQVGLAVANLRLRDSLRNQAIRDALTGLYNRRYFEEAAERELSRAKRHERPIVFMVLDVDHFKRFNDTHGHDAGDYLLREVGQLLRRSVRQSDFACRYGGEEFVIIMPESPLDEARRRADQIRAGFHSLGLSHQGKVLGPVTVSIGIASYPDHGSERDVLIRSADEALYRAKNEGRDRAVVASTPPSETRRPERAQGGAAGGEAVKSEPAKSEAAKSEVAKSEVAKTGAAKRGG
ncbi:MAG TPA: diguanylate cyclase [Polyangiaceae bacterium]|nr:diguanylate cyclase [Polyangiaceae bacterium]